MSFMIVPGLIGPMLGPVIGGVIATYTSWRWVFLINIPLGLAGIAAALVLLRPMAMPPPASFDLPGFILVALCFALLQIGFDWLSTPGSSALRICAMFLGSAALFTLFALYARVREYPVLDLALFRSRTFAVSVLVGAFARIGIASTPFLLPLLFQIPFHMSPLHSGLLTFATAVGQIAMRMSVERLLRRFGVRRMLIANSAITALLLAGMGMFRASTPDIVILVYLFVFGLLQSAQFSTLAALNFSGLAPAEMSRATSISAVVQRFSMSIGIALAAFVLNLASRGAPLNRSDFIAAFCVMAAIEACAIAGFWRLHAGDGADLTVRNRS
jgi:MFS family permease